LERNKIIKKALFLRSILLLPEGAKRVNTKIAMDVEKCRFLQTLLQMIFKDPSVALEIAPCQEL
jgi:hypothetical protein